MGAAELKAAPRWSGSSGTAGRPKVCKGEGKLGRLETGKPGPAAAAGVARSCWESPRAPVHTNPPRAMERVEAGVARLGLQRGQANPETDMKRIVLASLSCSR